MPCLSGFELYSRWVPLCRDANARRHLKWEVRQSRIQGWQYGKGQIYLRPIFWLTELAFLSARATLKGNTITAPEI